MGGVEDRRASGGGAVTYRDARRHGLSPGQIRTSWHCCPQLSSPLAYQTPTPKRWSSHKRKPFPMRPRGSISHNASFSASVAFRCFLSGVDSQLSGALRSKRWRSRPTVKLSNLVTKIGKNSLSPSLIIYLFAFSQGVTVPGAGLASN